MAVPKRGDVLFFDFEPVKGHEQGAARTAVVLTPEAYNRTTGMCIVVPTTTREARYSTDLPIPENPAVRGVALVNQVRSVDWRARTARVAGHVGGPFADQIAARVAVLMGLTLKP